MYHLLLRCTNDVTSPVGRDPIADMSLLVVSLSASLSFGGSIASTGYRWRGSVSIGVGVYLTRRYNRRDWAQVSWHSAQLRVQNHIPYLMEALECESSKDHLQSVMI